ncbi:aldehyde dehydrogenase family protein [Embleya sp. NPDC005971]|uniref:aldehyde dehydrogenase family protein n=1 Tax=Embleya sp. NPDC005971 TaxID=3156724 RepID=UPI0033F9D7EF
MERANASHFGLCGSAWSADADRAAEVASELECGTARVNTHFAVHPDQPFGGHKWSGVGSENGRWGVEAFTEPQVRHRAKGWPPKAARSTPALCPLVVAHVDRRAAASWVSTISTRPPGPSGRATVSDGPGGRSVSVMGVPVVRGSVDAQLLRGECGARDPGADLGERGFA